MSSIPSFPLPHRLRPALRWCTLLLALLALGARAGTAQAPLFLVNDSTTVRGIDFKFAGDQPFEEDRLLEQIATQEPGFLDRVKRILPFLSADRPPFDPIVLQKDVVRLRRFYRDNGFLTPEVDYVASQLDTTSNTIRVIFSVDAGPPLIIQDVGFYGPDGQYALYLFQDERREAWVKFRDRTSFQIGDRYTEFELLRIQDEVLTWLRDRGYAFAQVSAEPAIDAAYNTVDIRFTVEPGPLGVVREILVEGNESVSKEVVRRELPFEAGDRFSYAKLIQGQRELFGLNLFRLALADVPPACSRQSEEADTLQTSIIAPADSLCQPMGADVTVRYRVREAKLRYLTAQTGYGRQFGLTVQGAWTHRNFLGGARNLQVSATAYTGVLAGSPGGLREPMLYEASVSLQQPYLFTTRLNGFVRPFVRFERNPLLITSQPLEPGLLGGLGLDLNQQELGVTTRLIYEVLPFRTVNLSYTFSRVRQAPADSLLIDPVDVPVDEFDDLFDEDAYSKSILSLNATLGDVDDFLNPQRGFLVRPFIESAGRIVVSGVEYTKAGGDVVGYLPVADGVNLGGRLFAGRLWPRGESTAQFRPPFEDRFDNIRFYTGGASDVRGWSTRLLGPQRNLTVLDTTQATLLNDDGLPFTRNEQYEAVGGLMKLAGNLEVRLPFPGLGSAWRTAVFLDGGQVSARRLSSDPTLSPARQFEDDGRVRSVRFGTGAGVRYQTPVGYIRLDIAYKLNPDRLDLLTPREAYLEALTDLPASVKQETFGLPPDFAFDADLSPWQQLWRRLALHLSIGQAF